MPIELSGELHLSPLRNDNIQLTATRYFIPTLQTENALFTKKDLGQRSEVLQSNSARREKILVLKVHLRPVALLINTVRVNARF